MKACRTARDGLFINLAIKEVILSSLIVAPATLARIRESAGVTRARADPTVGGGTSLCRY